MTVSEQKGPGWHLKGTVLVACNCDYGCPCNFNALPTKGKCEGGWTWHVDRGAYNGVTLDGLSFSLFVNWPGAIHEGNGEGVALIDERAGEAQRDAIMTLLRGEAGGPWGILGWTWPTLHGPHLVPYGIALDGVSWRVQAGDCLEIQSEPIRNPVTGAEIRPAAVLPEGIVFKQAAFGASQTFRLTAEVEYDHSGQYTAVAPVEYAGP